MTAVEWGLAGQLALAGLGVLAALAAPARARVGLTGVLSALVGVAGAVTGIVVLSGGQGRLSLSASLPLDPMTLEPTALGGFFMLVAGAVGMVAAVYSIGYVHGAAAARPVLAAFPAFLAAMQLVPAAGGLLSFLAAWELMAVASTVLVLAEHASRAEVRRAGLWYAGMTHLSFVLILLGLALLAAHQGGTSWAELATADPDSATAAAAYLLLVVGFATKAGLVPFHVWLPRAHPAAPSHVSAAMSSAMVTMGVYGLLLVVVRLLPGGPTWFGVVLVALGAVSAVYGILQASAASDLKVLLGYSTTENTGLMVLAAGIGLLLREHGAPGAGDAALLACLLLVASHAAFKTALFLGAGAVLSASGQRDLDRMGGLGMRMPVTAVTFGVGALGAAALPVTVGFVAEWTLLQSLIHGARPGDRLIAVVMPVAVAVVALTAGLALLTFVKAAGITFLARPRSEGAATAREAPRPMQVALVLAAAVVVGLGLLPGQLATWAHAAVEAPSAVSDTTAIRLARIDAVLVPLAVATALGLAVALVAALASTAARQAPRRAVDLAWGCGGVRSSARMQYTATSYAEPLVRVFDQALRPQRDVEISHRDESRYLVEQVHFRQSLHDLVEARVYDPLLGFVMRVGAVGRRIQNGSIHRYLGYSFAALVLVLVVVSW